MAVAGRAGVANAGRLSRQVACGIVRRMFDVFPAAWFATTASTALAVVFLVLQLVSLLVLGAVVWEYRQLRGRHAAFFAAVSSGQTDRESRPALVLWLYVFSTLVMTVAYLFVFFVQPHLL